jgi:hypothetical protein
MDTSNSLVLETRNLSKVYKGVRWWWFAGAVAVEIAGLVIQAEYVLLVVLPLAWIWPLLIWSVMGARETRHWVEQLVSEGR